MLNFANEFSSRVTLAVPKLLVTRLVLRSHFLWVHLLLCFYQLDITNCRLCFLAVDIQTWQWRDTRSSYFWFACSRSHPWSIQCNCIRDTYSGKFFYHIYVYWHLVTNNSHKVFTLIYPACLVNFTVLWYNAGHKICRSCTSNFVRGSWWTIQISKGELILNLLPKTFSILAVLRQ